MPNALQITDPNADNPLAQAPSWADAYGSVGPVDEYGRIMDASPLDQWLAQQRAKMPQNGYLNTLQRIRPVDEMADPRMRAFRRLGTAPLKLPRGGFSQNYSPSRPPDEFLPEADWRQLPTDRNI